MKKLLALVLALALAVCAFAALAEGGKGPEPADGGNGCERPETTVCATEICFCIKSTRPEGIDPLDSAGFLHLIY